MSVEKVDKIWMNGKLVDWDDAKVHVLTHALHYGSGVFEGIRAYETAEGAAVFRLTDHMKRMQESAKIYSMEIPYELVELVDAVKDTIRVNKLKSCYIRPIAFRGYGQMGLFPLNVPVDVVIAVWPWGSYLGEESLHHGVRVKVSSFQRNNPNSIPPAAKASGQYLNSILAKIEVVAAGYDEAIMLNAHGFVADGSGENVFTVKKGVLSTPPLSSGALGGITRDSVMKIAADLDVAVKEENLTRTDLYNADEVFFTGTAAEIVPIHEVDDREVGDPGPITRKIQEIFFASVKGENDTYKDWLELV
ncbi:MAG: branched-chain amino acid transaminase [Actinobacteria bacterium]|nr:MAG: branched-chain amino acid transaminase [Actinomycetota bacterium]